ncbi:hypothetical protein ACS48_00335 [Bacillus cereus]|nr:hypothetical protein ACS48_00335 [Bacillus cereus]
MLKRYGASTVALTINTAKMSQQDARDYATKYEKELGIPAILPLEDGVDKLVPIFRSMIENVAVIK